MDKEWKLLVKELIDMGYTPVDVVNELADANMVYCEHGSKGGIQIP